MTPNNSHAHCNKDDGGLPNVKAKFRGTDGCTIPDGAQQSKTVPPRCGDIPPDRPPIHPENTPVKGGMLLESFLV